MRLFATAFLATLSSLSAQEFAAHDLFVGTSSFQNQDVAHFGRDAALLEHLDVANGVRDVAFGPDGLLYVSSFNQDRVFAVDASGGTVRQIGAGSTLDGPWGLAFGPQGRLYVASVNSDDILVFERSGEFVTTFTHPSFQSLRYLAFGPDGRLYVTTRDGANVGYVQTFDAGGTFLGTFAGNLTDPEGLAFDAAGRLFVAAGNVIRTYELDGTLARQFGAGTGLNQVHGLAFGANGNLYAASFGSASIFEFTAQGTFVDEFGNNLISQPHGLAVAPRRLVAKITAVAAQNGQSLKLKRVAVASLFPGAGTTMLAFEAGEGLLGSDALVFRGFEVLTASADKRMLHGASAPQTVDLAGIATLALDVQGTPIDDVFEIKKAKGTFHGSRAGFVFTAKIAISKPLN